MYYSLRSTIACTPMCAEVPVDKLFVHQNGYLSLSGGSTPAHRLETHSAQAWILVDKKLEELGWMLRTSSMRFNHSMSAIRLDPIVYGVKFWGKPT